MHRSLCETVAESISPPTSTLQAASCDWKSCTPPPAIAPEVPADIAHAGEVVFDSPHTTGLIESRPARQPMAATGDANE